MPNNEEPRPRRRPGKRAMRADYHDHLRAHRHCELCWMAGRKSIATHIRVAGDGLQSLCDTCFADHRAQSEARRDRFLKDRKNENLFT